MTAQATRPHRPAQHEGRDGFAQLVRAEWTKFRTVRGWVIGLVTAIVVMVGLGLFAAAAAAARARLWAAARPGPAGPARPRSRWGRAASR